jgi:RNA polymerase sigma-70 factor (ECF subfamily)
MADPAAPSMSRPRDTLVGSHTVSTRPHSRPTVETDSDFRRIFEEHAASVYRTLRYLGIAEADLMDAAQEVFLVVDRRRGEFEGRARLSTWIHEICVRVVLSTRRRRRRRHEDLVAEPPDAAIEADQDTRIEVRDRRDLLADLLDGLEDAQRQIIVLHEIEQLPMREVAEIVGCPLQTAYSRRNAALEQMRNRLAARRKHDEQA